MIDLCTRYLASKKASCNLFSFDAYHHILQKLQMTNVGAYLKIGLPILPGSIPKILTWTLDKLEWYFSSTTLLKAWLETLQAKWLQYTHVYYTA